MHILKRNLHTSSPVMRMVHMVDTSRMFEFLIKGSRTFHEFLKVLIKLKLKILHCSQPFMTLRKVPLLTVLKDNFRDRPIILARSIELVIPISFNMS